MNKSVVGSVVAIVVATVAVLAGAVILLGAEQTPSANSANGNLVVQTPASGAGEADPVPAGAVGAIPGADERADCIEGGVAGIDLPCLGGNSVPGDHAEVTVVNVWAWWCTPCQEELPVMNQFAAKYPEIDVVGIHSDPNEANGVALFNDLGIDFPSYQDAQGKFAALMGLPNVVPVIMVFNGGKIAGVFPQAYYSLESLEAAISGVL